MSVINAWVGAPTKTGFSVVAKIDPVPPNPTLRVATNSGMTGAASVPMTANGHPGIYRANVTGRPSNTRHWWAISEDGAPMAAVGQARTAPDGAASFSFWSSSCAETGSTHPVFDQILAHDPHFGLHMGDLHYRDIKVNDVSTFHGAYDQVLASPNQAALYRNVPIFYVWDDHDYGENDTDYYSPSRSAAIASYRQRVPHPPLPDSEGVWQTFAWGRVRFIMFDGRSCAEREPKTILGTPQRDWIKATLSAATEEVAIISTAFPWTGTQWGALAGSGLVEREEISNWLAANGWLGKIIFTAGDAHSIAYTDGSTNPYGGLYAPIFQTAALDRSGSQKGGTWTRGPILNRGQYGLWEVTDTGGTTITVTMHAYSEGSLLWTEAVDFTVPAGTPAPEPDPDPSGLLFRTDGSAVTLSRTDGTPVAPHLTLE